jgi:methyl-accepting chemotaxis protein
LALYQITTKPIKRLGEVMRALTKNHLETEVPYVAQATEIGSMARKVEVFKKNAIEKRQLEAQSTLNESKAREDKKRSMHSLADRFEHEVQTIIESVIKEVEQVKSLSERINTMISGATEKATSVASTAESTSQNVSTVASAAEEMSATALEVAGQITKSTDSVREAVAANNDAKKVSEALEKGTSKIGEIVTIIQSIAGQINLLALNATIESARAGEAGKGFAVVASEVKNLAGQTGKATDEISVQIIDIQTVSKQVMEALLSISGSVSQVENASTTIASAISQQTSATTEIARNINAVASSTQQISENIAGVRQASVDANQCANDALKAVVLLQSNANRLNDAVQSFLSEVRAA